MNKNKAKIRMRTSHADIPGGKGMVHGEQAKKHERRYQTTLAPDHTENHGTTNSSDSRERQTQLRGELAAQVSTIHNTLEQDMAYTRNTALGRHSRKVLEKVTPQRTQCAQQAP